MAAYYNENDRNAAAWLRELIKAGLIAPGDVDERSIVEVRPGDLAGYTQCHFFAGIGVWSYALRLAGWDDSRGIWTGSCPCQPFSGAGGRAGFDDERHLWPHWFQLIAQCRPDVIFGEQVASKDGLGWLDVVQADLEAAGYAFAAADLPASGVGAPHLRQRLYFVGQREKLQQVWGGETPGDVFSRREASGRAAVLLQAVRQGSARSVSRGKPRPGEAPKPREESGVLAAVSGSAQGARLGAPRETAGRGEGFAVRSGSAHPVLAETPGPRGLRGNWGSLGDDGREALQQPVVGSESPGAGVCDQEHPSGVFCDQLRDGGLGRGDSSHARSTVAFEVNHDPARTDDGKAVPGHQPEDSIRSVQLRVDYSTDPWRIPRAGAASVPQEGPSLPLADAQRPGLQARPEGDLREALGHDEGGLAGEPRQRSVWSNCDWIPCRDGKLRPVEPGTQPLVDGAPARVVRLRAYGNAIVSPCAAAFISSYLDTLSAQ